MSPEPIRMRPSLLVRVAIFWPLMSTTTEFWAFANCARSSSWGRSLATAIMIPKIQETKASTDRPKKTRAKRNFLSFGRRRAGPGPGGVGGEAASRGGPEPFDPPLTLASRGGAVDDVRAAGGPPSRERRLGSLILGDI